MIYDIFISYSRKDSGVVDKICTELDRYGLKYFRDTESLFISDDFPRKLADAISSSKIVLFIASKNSYASQYVVKEIVFAYNEKVNVLPYIVDDENIPIDIKFLLSDVNRKTIKTMSIPALVEEIVGLLKEDNVQVKVNHKDNVKNRKFEYYLLCAIMVFMLIVGFCWKYNKVNTEVSLIEENEPIHKDDTTKRYAIGDYYEKNNVKGVVFDVDSTGMHGKIISLTQSSALQWCIDQEYSKVIKTPNGTSSESDGMFNFEIIKKESDWEVKYPAFAWCANLGEGWYLPAIWELEKFTLNSDTFIRVSETLSLVSGMPLFANGSAGRYWSSTEYAGFEFCAWGVLMNEERTGRNNKNGRYYVRAVLSF